MEVLRARVMGFCMGVRRAVEQAEAELAKQGRVYSLGPLIHNPQALDSLAARGLVILDNGRREQLKNSSVIIRAHGVGPEVEESLSASGAKIVDATCPRVKASQNLARTLALSGYTVFIAGQADHAEVRGIAGYVRSAGAEARIVGSAEEAAVDAGAGAGGAAGTGAPGAVAAGAAGFPSKAALLAQTTFSEQEFQAIADALRSYFPLIEVKNTICGATRERQEALAELCGRVDAVVVAGGRESANTRRLLAIAQSHGKPAFLAEKASDLPPELAKTVACGAHRRAGLCAGASTPDGVIDEIERFMVNCL
jgi:4-hydroxy-3-methylbut-2-enyl diphosphate reductase